MRRFLVVIGIAAILLGCAGGGKYPPPVQIQADLSLKKFRDLFLQGRFCAAEDAFRTAIRGYSAIDSPCDIAEAYLQRYLFYSYLGMKEEDLLERAEEFVSLGDCQKEQERIEAYKVHNPPNAEAEDSLWRSVSLRKEALQKKDSSLLEKALEIDRAENWSALLWVDLKALTELSKGRQRQRYQKRLSLLEETLELDCLKP